MNKEPIGLYIFRFVSGFALLAFMCMLYWSSVIVENQVRTLSDEVGQLKNDLFGLRSDMDRVRSDVLQAILDASRQRQGGGKQDTLQEASDSGGRVPMPLSKKQKASDAGEVKKESAFENLLKPDPFYLETLPKMLGSDFSPGNTRHTATIGKPDNLHPFSNWSQVNSWRELCGVRVAKLAFGKYETLAPDMALRVEERPEAGTGIVEHWVFLRDGVYWQPLSQELFAGHVKLAPHFLRKHQVTAEDFKFFFDALMNPYVQEPQAVALRTYYNAVREIEIIDKLTFVVRWKTESAKGDAGKIKYIAKELVGELSPLPSFVYKYFSDGRKIVESDASDTYRTNSAWAQNFSQHWAKNVIVSCGPWTFEGMSDRQIMFKRNADFYAPYAALSARMEVDLKDSVDTLWQEFKVSRLDTYSLQPEQVLELQDFLASAQYKEQERAGNSIHRLDYIARTYSYIGWNQARPFFSSKKVRQALTMAIDRQRIIRQNLNGMGIEINGTFYRYSPAYDTSIAPWPFDPQQARRLLEEEGWYDSDGDGVIDKVIDGKVVPFRFALTYFVKNPTSKAVCEYIATALKELGIVCNLKGVDLADLSSVFDDKNFDALSLAWTLGTPPEDPRQVWYSAGAKEKGSSNAVGFANAEADKIIEALDYEYDPEKRYALYHRFDAIIHEEQPYTFLYTPKVALLYRDYLQNVFIPADRQDLVPGANIGEPEPEVFWIKKTKAV